MTAFNYQWQWYSPNSQSNPPNQKGVRAVLLLQIPLEVLAADIRNCLLIYPQKGFFPMSLVFYSVLALGLAAAASIGFVVAALAGTITSPLGTYTGPFSRRNAKEKADAQRIA